MARQGNNPLVVLVTLFMLDSVSLLVVQCDGSEPHKDQTVEDGLQTIVDQLRPVKWKVNGAPTGRLVRIVSMVGRCAGAGLPRIKVVHIVEKPRRVLLTAMLTVVSSDTRKGCAGVAVGVRKTIRLRRPVANRALYDASATPPALRWP